MSPGNHFLLVNTTGSTEHWNQPPAPLETLQLDQVSMPENIYQLCYKLESWMWWAKLTQWIPKKALDTFLRQEWVLPRLLPILTINAVIQGPQDSTHCCHLGENTANELQCQPYEVNWVSRNFTLNECKFGDGNPWCTSEWTIFVSFFTWPYNSSCTLKSSAVWAQQLYAESQSRALLLALALWTKTTQLDEKSHLFWFVGFVGYFFS